MKHIEEKILERYVLRADGGTDPAIEAHLKECPGCDALRQQIKSYYDEFSEIRRERTVENPEAITLRNMRVAPFETLRMPVTLPARVVLFAIRHPAYSVMSLAAAIVLALVLLYPGKAPKDLNPSYARPKDEFLVVYNKDGEELWRKHVEKGWDIELAKWPLNRRSIFTADADGDGKNEVFCIYGGIYDNPTLNAVFCYNPDGSERWKYQYHRNISFGSESFVDNYFFNSMVVGDFDRDGHLDIIAELEHAKRYPNVIIRLDAKTGDFLGEFWHPGNVEYMAHRDIDGDGVEEIFLTSSNAFAGAAPLLVLDPRAIKGVAPVPPEFAPSGVPQGLEKYYLLFPRSGLEKSKDFLSTAGEVMYFKSDGTLELIVSDHFKNGTSFALNFYLDSTMRCTKVLATEPNLQYARRLQSEELTLRKITESILDSLRTSIQYWDGEKFVNEPTMNKYYKSALKPLP